MSQPASSSDRNRERATMQPDAGSGATAIGHLQVPSAPMGGGAGSARATPATGLKGIRNTLEQGRRRLRHALGDKRAMGVVARRPDGTPVAPGPEVAPKHSTAAGIAAQVTAPLRSAKAAVRERWGDALREGRLAAQEKAGEMRSDYERRVRHDPRLHVQQHNRKQDGS